MSQNISLIDAIIRLRKMDGLLFPLSLATVAPLLYIYLAEVPQGGSWLTDRYNPAGSLGARGVIIYSQRGLQEL